MNPNRLQSVLRGMADGGIPQMVVSDPAAIYYLTGKWIHPGQRMLALRLSRTGRHALFVNELFSVPEELGVEKIWINDNQDGVELLAGSLDSERTVGIDKTWPARFLLRLMEVRPSHHFVNASVILDRLRMRKDADEREVDAGSIPLERPRALENRRLAPEAVSGETPGPMRAGDLRRVGGGRVCV